MAVAATPIRHSLMARLLRPSSLLHVTRQVSTGAGPSSQQFVSLRGNAAATGFTQHVQPVCPLLPRSSEQPHILPSFVIQKLDRGEILDRAMDTDALPTLDQEDNNDIVMEAITMKKRRARKVTKHQKRKRRKRDLMERRITRRHEKIRTKKVKRIG